MSLTALIPARGGSKGVPKKNIKTLQGHPLIAYSIAACALSDKIKNIIVSTDDELIAEIAQSYGAHVPGLRPDHLASDTSTDWDVVDYFFQNNKADDVVYLRPTTPLRDPKLLDNCIDTYLESKNSASGFRSMHELPEPPYKMFMIQDGFCKGFFHDFNGIKDYTNLPRQMFPKAYQPNGYIDIVKRETIYNSKSAFGQKVFPFITPHVSEIDTLEEFKLIQYQIKNQHNNKLLSYLNELKIYDTD